MKSTEINVTAVNLLALCLILSFACVTITGLLLYLVCSRKYRLNWFEKNLLETADSKELQLSQESFVQVQDNSEDIKSFFADCTKDDKCPQYLQPCEDRESITSIPASPTSFNSYQLNFPLSSNLTGKTDSDIVAVGKPRIPSMQAKLDHTKIDSSLYQNETTIEEEEVNGSIHIMLTCDPVAGILTVKLIEAHDLQIRESIGTANPYAKLRLLPNKTNVWQTRIHKKTLNPVFDEDFVFEVQTAALSNSTLEVLLYNFDAYSRHRSIGSAQFPLANIDLSEKADLWRTLTPIINQDPQVDLGELMVSLSYLSSAERLTVVIIKARNLRVVDETRNSSGMKGNYSSDPYVKVSIVNGVKRIKKRKTGVHRNTVCPVINEALTFDIAKDILRKSCIEFYVMHDSLLGSSEVLGYCKVGGWPDCRQEDKEFFHSMLHSKTATAQWLPLSEHKSFKEKIPN